MARLHMRWRVVAAIACARPGVVIRGSEGQTFRYRIFKCIFALNLSVITFLQPHASSKIEPLQAQDIY